MFFNFQKKEAVKAPRIDSKRERELLLFQNQVGVEFNSLELLNLAFCHRSYVNESASEIENNERLEFLGDSVLGLIASEYLYEFLWDKPEGELARIKSVVVSENSLSKIAKTIHIDNFILIGKGEEYSGGRSKKAILADCMEALIGAYYLDSGFNPVKEFVLSYLAPEIECVLEDKYEKDYKTLLQEFVQKKYKTCPKYKLIRKVGPDHDKTFLVEVHVADDVFGPGEGKNKKTAEQNAAGIAYNHYINLS